MSTRRTRSTLAGALAAGLLLLTPAAAYAAQDDNDGRPIINSDDYQPSPGNTIAHKPHGAYQGGQRVTLYGCWQNNSLGNLVPCGGGGGGTYSPPQPPPRPATPARLTPPAAPGRPSVECFDDGHGSLLAAASFTATANSTTARREYRVRWDNDRASSQMTPAVQAQIDASQQALDASLTAAVQQAAIQARIDADAAHSASEAAAAAEGDAQIAAVDAEWYAWRSGEHATEARRVMGLAFQSFWDAEAEVYSRPRTGFADPAVTIGTGLTSRQHSAQAEAQEVAAAAAADAAELHRIAAADAVALITGNPLLAAADAQAQAQAEAAVAAARAEAEAGNLAAVTAQAHADAADALSTDAQAAHIAAIADAATALRLAEITEADAVQAEAAADTAALQRTLDLLIDGANPQTILIDETPTINGTQGNSEIAPPLIASFDKLTAHIAFRTSQRASASNPAGTTYSSWSAWSLWSPWSPAGYEPDGSSVGNGNGTWDPGEPYTDTNNNGSWDPGESFTDAGVLGCPIPTSTPTTPTQTPCTHDPTRIAAVYPPGHPQAGQPTGHCYPPGSPCLPPPNGTGALDVVCSPRGS